MIKYQIKAKLNLGITNQNYQSIDNLFIRYSSPFTNLFIDHQNEIFVLEQIKNSDLTLPIVDYGYDGEHFFWLHHIIQLCNPLVWLSLQTKS